MRKDTASRIRTSAPAISAHLPKAVPSRWPMMTPSRAHEAGDQADDGGVVQHVRVSELRTGAQAQRKAPPPARRGLWRRERAMREEPLGGVLMHDLLFCVLGAFDDGTGVRARGLQKHLHAQATDQDGGRPFAVAAEQVRQGVADGKADAGHEELRQAHVPGKAELLVGPVPFHPNGRGHAHRVHAQAQTRHHCFNRHHCTPCKGRGE